MTEFEILLLLRFNIVDLNLVNFRRDPFDPKPYLGTRRVHVHLGVRDACHLQTRLKVQPHYDEWAEGNQANKDPFRGYLVL